MKVVYFYAGVYNGKDYPEQRRLASISIASVRRQMPQVEIVHLTDERMRPLTGVDSVIRCELRPKTNRGDFQATIEDDVLFLDTDTILLRDVSYVFHDADFQVALSRFPGEQPFNQGVVFSRAPRFWDAVARRARENGVYDERAFNDVLLGGDWRVKELPDLYNFTPPPDLAIFHFKGPRKKVMLCLS